MAGVPPSLRRAALAAVLLADCEGAEPAARAPAGSASAPAQEGGTVLPLPEMTLADPVDVPPDWTPMPKASSPAEATGGGVRVDEPAVAGGPVPNVGLVVDGLTAGFRRCYGNGLSADPDMKGSLRITATIGPDGEVLSATAAGGRSLSVSVVACLTARVRSARFSPPKGGSAKIVIPVTLVRPR